MARRAVLLALLALVLAGPRAAGAATGVRPVDETVPVTLDAAGYVASPESLDLVVALAAGDTAATVWVSTSPERTETGRPAGGAVGSCDASKLRPLDGAGTFACALGTLRLRPGTAYHWWLAYAGADGSPAVAGPYRFVLADPSAPTRPAPSTMTLASAARLPSRARFTGGRSIKDTRLTRIVAQTMRAKDYRPRTLAVACWTSRDFDAVLASAGRPSSTRRTTTLGFWFPVQPRWLHLGPDVCADAQRLLDTKAATGRNAAGLAVALHETMHAYGIRNEAQANCLAVQLIPTAGVFAGLPRARARYLGSLALRYVRATAPPRYWDYARCRDGGAWDIEPRRVNLR